MAQQQSIKHEQRWLEPQVAPESVQRLRQDLEEELPVVPRVRELPDREPARQSDQQLLRRIQIRRVAVASESAETADPLDRLRLRHAADGRLPVHGTPQDGPEGAGLMSTGVHCQSHLSTIHHSPHAIISKIDRSFLKKTRFIQISQSRFDTSEHVLSNVQTNPCCV